jgi:spore germination protein GerM
MTQRGVVGVISAGLVTGLALVWWFLPKFLTQSNTGAAGQATEANAPAAPGASRTIPATLFFVSDNGTALTPVSAQVPYGASPAEQGRAILEAQLAAPPDGRVSAIPAGVTLRGVYFTPRGNAYVDLSREIMSGHPGGSTNETLTVYTLVLALTANIRDVTAVQILVDGRQVDSLAGHIDLRQPLTADARWVQKGQ